MDCLVASLSLPMTRLQQQRQPSPRLMGSLGFSQIGRLCCHFYVDLYDNTRVWWWVPFEELVEPPEVNSPGLLPQTRMLRSLKRRRTLLPPLLQASSVFPRTAKKKTPPQRQPVAQRWEGDYSLNQKRRKILLRVSLQLSLPPDSISTGPSGSTDEKSRVPGPSSALTFAAQPLRGERLKRS